MGFRDWLRGSQNTNEPVYGAMELTSCTAGGAGRIRMHGTVSGPGLPQMTVDLETQAPPGKWPQAGQTLPVTVRGSRFPDVEVRWEEVPGSQPPQACQDSATRQAGQPGRQVSETYQVTETYQLGGNGGQGRAAEASLESILPPGSVPARMKSVFDRFGSFGAGTAGPGTPDRPAPGMAGGGLTPQQAAEAVSGGGMDMGLQQATARVTAVRDVPGTPGESAAGTADLTLDVMLPSGGGYTTTLRIGFSTPARREQVASAGTALPVLVNPAQRDQIAIDTSRMAF